MTWPGTRVLMPSASDSISLPFGLEQAAPGREEECVLTAHCAGRVFRWKGWSGPHV